MIETVKYDFVPAILIRLFKYLGMNITNDSVDTTLPPVTSRLSGHPEYRGQPGKMEYREPDHQNGRYQSGKDPFAMYCPYRSDDRAIYDYHSHRRRYCLLSGEKFKREKIKREDFLSNRKSRKYHLFNPHSSLLCGGTYAIRITRHP